MILDRCATQRQPVTRAQQSGRLGRRSRRILDCLRFIENGVRWAHIDMAGKAWSDKASSTYEKGATGFGVRLLDQYVADVVEA